MSNLTGQFIANSYQNLVQKPDLTKEEYYNGVGTQITVINRDAIGTVKMFFPVNNNYNNCFDSNGLGINDWEGWAICDGRNGTPDLRGRFPIAKTDILTTTAEGASVPTTPDSTIANTDVTNPAAFRTHGNRGAGGVPTGVGVDLPLYKPILQQNNLPPHRHGYSFFTAEYFGGSNWQQSHSNAFGSSANTVETGTGELDDGNDSRNRTYFTNTGDGTNNINAQDALPVQPLSFYPPYFVLSFAIRIS